MDWKTFIRQYQYPLVGGIIGLLIALFLIHFGILKTLLTMAFIILGMNAAIYLKRTGLLDQLLK
ncbi:TPA: DUF2273 domain-containing protein [Streptococcus suis]